jgi:sulfur carrier protein
VEPVKVDVNGQSTDVSRGESVAALVAKMGRESRIGVAVALNGEIVPRSSWPHVTLSAGDRVEVLDAVSGG